MVPFRGSLDSRVVVTVFQGNGSGHAQIRHSPRAGPGSDAISISPKRLPGSFPLENLLTCGPVYLRLNLDHNRQLHRC